MALKIFLYAVTVAMVIIFGWQCTVPGDEWLDMVTFGIWSVSLGMDIKYEILMRDLRKHYG